MLFQGGGRFRCDLKFRVAGAELHASLMSIASKLPPFSIRSRHLASYLSLPKSRLFLPTSATHGTGRPPLGLVIFRVFADEQECYPLW